jgi:steroid 5-alpha reductase family enzyme
MHPVAMIALVALAGMSTAWAVQQRTKVAGWVDVAWSYMVGGSAVLYAALGSAPAAQRIAVALMGALWGLRLGTHLAIRLRHEKEDGRYAYMRQAIGDHGGKWYAFYLFQAGLTVLFSLPLWVAANNTGGGPTLLVAGIAIWAFSLAGESIADRQLAAFRGNPANKGKVCDVGLWRYSRHPNYFFEWLHWFAWVALAIGSPWWWLSLLGAALMLASLLWVTGIPFVEQQSLRSRGEAYREYQRRVSVFVPWFPKAGPRAQGPGPS